MTNHQTSDVRTRGIALAVAAAGISGLAVFLNGYGVRAAPDPTVYTTAKNLVAALILGLVAVAVRPWRTPARTGGAAAEPSPGSAGAKAPPGSAGAKLPPGRVAALVAVGVIGGSVPFVLFFEGLARASSTHAAFVQKTLVVWVALLAVLLLRERLRAVHVVAIALLLAGQIALDGGLAGFRAGTGELLILGATLLWAVEVILVKRLLADLAPATVGVARMVLGSALLIGWLAVTGRLDTLAGLDATAWGWALLTGAILAGYVATWFAALSYAPAIDVTAVLVLAAPITAALSAAASGRLPASPAAVGTVLVVAGAALVAVAARRPVAPPVPVS